MIGYEGKVCPYCKSELQVGEDIVICSICEMPHHKECWIENKACTTFGCTGTISGIDTSVCTACGAPANEGQKFCAACGNNLTGAVTQQGNQNVQYQPVQTPYGYQQQAYTNAPQLQHQTPYNYAGAYDSSIDSEMLSFLDKNQAYYIDEFNKLKNNNTTVSWNWCAFLFGYFWFAYRKMHLIAIVCAVSVFIASFIPTIGVFISLALFLCSGLFGNMFYMQYVDDELAVLKRTPDIHRQNYIANKGKTNIGAVWVYVGVFVLIILLRNL